MAQQQAQSEYKVNVGRLIKTKIVCTLGPACSDPKVLEEMILSGMDVVRLNFSHGTHEEHKKIIQFSEGIVQEIRRTSFHYLRHSRT